MQPFCRKTVRPASSVSVSGRQFSDGSGSKVLVGSTTTMPTTVKKASIAPTVAMSGVMSIFLGGWGGQFLGWTASLGICGTLLMRPPPLHQ